MRWRSIVVVAVLVVAAGCTANAETEQIPSGPCLNGPGIRVGDSSLTVVAGDEEISPALDFEALEYCPGHEYEGRLGSEADGFLYAIDESVVQATPGSIITIRGPATQVPVFGLASRSLMIASTLRTGESGISRPRQKSEAVRSTSTSIGTKAKSTMR